MHITDALLADLQNSVPNHQLQGSHHQQQLHQHQQQSAGSNGLQHAQQQQQAQQQQLQSSVPGYGSLRPKQSPQSVSSKLTGVSNRTHSNTLFCQQPLYQTLSHQQHGQSPSPVFNGSPGAATSRSGTPHNSLPRSQTPQHQPQQQYQPGNASAAAGGGNLSELDTLLQDLSSARYGSGADGRSGHTTGSLHRNGTASPAPLNDSYQRPSVDSLLDELSSANNTTIGSLGPIYAVPNG